MEQTEEKEGGVLGNGMETSRGTLLSSGIPPLLSSLWIVPCMHVNGGGESRGFAGCSVSCLVFGAVVGNVPRLPKR